MEEPTSTTADQGEPEPLNVGSVATEVSLVPIRPPSARTSSPPRSTSAGSEAPGGESTAPKYVKDLMLVDLHFSSPLCGGTHQVLMPPIANMSLPVLA
jgi:hypothetical protein